MNYKDASGNAKVSDDAHVYGNDRVAGGFKMGGVTKEVGMLTDYEENSIGIRS